MARGRLTGLDGLRGVAALVVVIHHALLAVPALAESYRTSGAHVPGAARWLVYSPLHLLWAGGEAVVVFFVLSGFVLTLPLIRRGGQWRAYYPKRLARLYLPVFGAVALSVVWVTLFPRHIHAGASWWLNMHTATATFGAVANDLVLLHRDPGFLNTPLWSLRWEVVFSLLLPVYAVAATRGRSGWIVKIGVLIALTGFGAARGIEWVAYLPMFGVGAVMAVERERLAAITLTFSGRRWAIVTATGLVLLDAAWLTPEAARANVVAAAAVRGAVLVGAAILVLAVLHWKSAARVVDRRPVQWLGSRSFSLYLVHEPLLVSLALVLRPHPWMVLVVGLPLSLVLADVFYRLVEAPAHRASQWIGKVMARSRPVPVGAPADEPSPTARVLLTGLLP